MREVKRHRAGLDWSAERLAEEMTAVGVPWTRDVVVNLENGRRKSIAAHEVIALAYVLDLETPLDLFVPHDNTPISKPLVPDSLPVTPSGPNILNHVLRDWFRGEIGSLQTWYAKNGPRSNMFHEAITAAMNEASEIEEGSGDLIVNVEKMKEILNAKELGVNFEFQMNSREDGGEDVQWRASTRR